MNFINSTDCMLIERSQDGDRAAFDQLLKRHEAHAYRFANQLTHDPEEAGDVVAEAVLRMYKGILTFRGGSSFTTWMYRITTNCFLDSRKKRKGVAIHFGSICSITGQDAELQLADRGPSPFDIVSVKEDFEAVKRASLQLLNWQQRILIMRYKEMRSYEEIASVLGVPIGTVKSRINRARVRLRTGMLQKQVGSRRPTKRVLDHS